MTGERLGGALALGMAGLGVAACVAPGPTSALYGVPQGRADRDGQAWVRAAGLRDLGLAAALGVLLAERAPRAAGVVCAATACVAIADGTNLIATRGASPLPLVVHASGVAVGLLAAWALISR